MDAGEIPDRAFGLFRRRFRAFPAAQRLSPAA